MEFDIWNGYPRYNQYWTNKREEYKELILSLQTGEVTVDDKRETIVDYENDFDFKSEGNFDVEEFQFDDIFEELDEDAIELLDDEYK